MQPREFMSRAQGRLAKRGVLGSRAGGLLEEWNDHLETEIEKLMASGERREIAGSQACEALGEPAALADRAARQLNRATWQGRHPWLSAGIIFVALAFLSMALIDGFASMLIEAKLWENIHPRTIWNLGACISTAPWVFGLVWLAWYARKMPAGWKGFWVVSGLVGLGLNVLNFAASPPLNGPGTGVMSFGFGYHPTINLFKFICTAGLAGLFWWRTTQFRGASTIAQATIWIGAFWLCGCSTAGKMRAMENAMKAVDQGRVQGMTDDTEFTYSIPNSHNGPYSDIDRYNLVFQNRDKTGGNATFFLGKSRKSGEWEVFLIMIWGKETGLKWKALPVNAIE
jgi:hypothetical protein